MASGATIHQEIRVGPGVAIAINLDTRRSTATYWWDIRPVGEVEEELSQITEEGKVCNYKAAKEEGERMLEIVA